MVKKAMLVALGFLVGFLVANMMPLPSVGAQMAFEGSDFEVENIEPDLPASYGRLVAVSGATMYFQSDNGSVYIVKPRNSSLLDTDVRVIERG